MQTCQSLSDSSNLLLSSGCLRLNNGSITNITLVREPLRKSLHPKRVSISGLRPQKQCFHPNRTENVHISKKRGGDWLSLNYCSSTSKRNGPAPDLVLSILSFWSSFIKGGVSCPSGCPSVENTPIQNQRINGRNFW